MRAIDNASDFRKVAASAGFLEPDAQVHIVRLYRHASGEDQLMAEIAAFESNASFESYASMLEANALDLPGAKAERIIGRLHPDLAALIDEISAELESREAFGGERAQLFALQLFSEIAWNIEDGRLQEDPAKARAFTRLVEEALAEAEDEPAAKKLKIGGHEP